MKIKNFVEKFGYRKLSLGIVLVLILALIVWGIKGTHAFYSFSTGPIQIFNSRVGNFAGKGDTSPLKDKNTDVNLLFYVQDLKSTNGYYISPTTPVAMSGYSVDKDRSNCIPNENEATYNPDYSIGDDGTVNIEVSEDEPSQVVCRIYYGFSKELIDDIIIFALLEDDYGTVSYNNKTYALVANVPNSGYTYETYECKNAENIQTDVKYDPSSGFTFETNGPNICYAYFKKSA